MMPHTISSKAALIDTEALGTSTTSGRFLLAARPKK